MFDQILNLVKEHLGNNPQVNEAIPADKADEVHKEIATHVTEGIKNQASGQGGIGGLLSMLKGGVANGGPVAGAIEGGLVNSLATKFGLSPAITGAIAGAIPSLLQKFASKASDPNDSSISMDNITKSLSGIGGGLGNLFK